MRNAECGIRFRKALFGYSVFKLYYVRRANRAALIPHSAFRIPRSAVESPARFNNSGDLPLKRQVSKRDARNTKLAKVTTRSARLRTSVANTDGAPVAGHLLQQYHCRVDFFRLRSRIVDDLLRRPSTLCPQGDAFLALFVLYYFADLCHFLKFLVPSFWFLVRSFPVLTRNQKLGTRNFPPTGGRASPTISKAIVPGRQSAPS